MGQKKEETKKGSRVKCVMVSHFNQYLCIDKVYTVEDVWKDGKSVKLVECPGVWWNIDCFEVARPEQCEQCRFWVFQGGWGGKCHKRAPIAEENIVDTQWPPTPWYEWCGDFERKEEKDEQD